MNERRNKLGSKLKRAYTECRMSRRNWNDSQMKNNMAGCNGEINDYLTFFVLELSKGPNGRTRAVRKMRNQGMRNTVGLAVNKDG